MLMDRYGDGKVDQDSFKIFWQKPWKVFTKRVQSITAIGGALFMRTHLKSGSGWLADLEHAILGNVAFTIGYGQWLYSGAAG